MLVKLFILLISVSVCFCSCSKKNAENQQSQTQNLKSEPIKIALVMKTLTNPFFNEVEKGARKAEKEFGIQLEVKTGAKETSIDQQIAIVEELIVNKVDAIVIAPGSLSDLIPCLKKAQDAGIIVVNIDERLDSLKSEQAGLKKVPLITVDNVQGAYLSAKFIADQIRKPAHAVILDGILSSDNAVKRKAGALKAFAENPNIKIVAAETANWNIDEANVVIDKLYKKDPNIKLIFCSNDMMALGVIEYLSKNPKKDVLVAGYDALEEAKKAVIAGTLTATIDQQAALQGYLGVKTALALLNSQPVDLKTYAEVKLITKEVLK